ncbi:hypothetical protein SERLA73DRAFT_139444, partial [Serpula lacrymans var. lacrymans S7.3]
SPLCSAYGFTTTSPFHFHCRQMKTLREGTWRYDSATVLGSSLHSYSIKVIAALSNFEVEKRRF